MYLENLVLDAAQPQVRGRFWEQALGTVNLTDEADIVETRLFVDGGPTLDLCFQQVADPVLPSPRLHLDLHPGADQEATVQRLLGLGASHLDIGQGDVPWVVLADPEGHPFCVLEDDDSHRDSGPIAAVTVVCTDPARDAAFWAGLTGWQPSAGSSPYSLRHPSGRGLVLEFGRPEQDPERPATAPKTVKNQLHLDLRLEPADDPATELARVEALGAVRIEHDWGDLPWTPLRDPSGNEFCFLPSRSR